jgi:hypothetical protein
MSDPSAAPAEALTAALRQLLAPLARLALARGLTHATLDELMKQTLVQVADDALQALPPHRRASRVTTTTGIHRREVTRLLQVLREGGDQAAPAQRSHASELFAHWRSHPLYCSRPGVPLALPRQGPAPSFEALAQGITRDVHPRSLLDELLRLGLAEVDEARDTVRLLRETFVPLGDDARLVQVLGRNVGSHLQAAVDNVLLGPSSHLEQALFANGLSDGSLAELRQLAQAQWQALVATLVPAVEAMLARDEGPDAPAGERHRIRLGLYTHQQAEPASPPDPAATAPRNTP